MPFTHGCQSFQGSQTSEDSAGRGVPPKPTRFSFFQAPPVARIWIRRRGWSLVSVAFFFWIATGGANWTLADEFAGKWRGRWTTESQGPHYGHQGTLRMNLRPQPDGSYRGTFAGRFAVVIPYIYTAPVYRTETGLFSSKRLGPFGNYEMRLEPSRGILQGGWTAGGEHGGIYLSR